MQIFISYHHGDEDFAEVLRSRVEADDMMAAWTFREKLRAGDDWRHEIDYAIRTSAALVHVMTPEAAQSRYVTYEWAYAMGLGIPVIPVLLRPTERHPKLSVLQHLDFTRTHRPWAALLRDVREQAQRCHANLRRFADQTAKDLLTLSPGALGDIDLFQHLLSELLNNPATAIPTLRAIESASRREGRRMVEGG